jgi:GNAT superfamily N-acetyltransferase
MASAEALRGEDGAGPVIPGGWFLSYLFVVPERRGEGIGGAILDAVLARGEAAGLLADAPLDPRRQRAFAPSLPEPWLLANGPNRGW